ncbi:MAG: glycosyltransferase family 39 protein [Gemmataceae bacterium]
METLSHPLPLSFAQAPRGGDSNTLPSSASQMRFWVGCFWLWLLLRTVVWFLVTVCACANAPLDLVEWLSWGHVWSWGYPKHPPLPAWVASVFQWLSPGEVWSVYLASYLVTALCLVAAWKLALCYLSPRFALLAVMAMDGLTFLTINPAEFNNNILLNAGWAWMVYCSHQALFQNKSRWWVAVGVTWGLSFLCKYTVMLLAAPLVFFWLLHADVRRAVGLARPCLAGAIALAIVMPHLIWMAHNDFITITYALERSADLGGIEDHWENPLIFLATQLALLIPVIIILLPALDGTRSQYPPTTELRFLHYAVLGPLIVFLIYSAVTGSLIRNIWGSPLWTFFGVWLLANWKNTFSLRTTSAVWLTWSGVALSMIGIQVVRQTAGPYLLQHPLRTHFPGKLLAREVTNRWHQHFDQSFAIVGGEPWIAGNICCYVDHHPLLYSSGCLDCVIMEEKDIPWTNDEDLKSRGGIIVWDARRYGDAVPMEIQQRFADLMIQEPIELKYQTSASLPPARIGLAFVPPARHRHGEKVLDPKK